MVQKIQKRDGRKVIFNPEKIYVAIKKAADACQVHDEELIQKAYNASVKEINKQFKKTVPTVEQVQDIIEKTLIHQECSDIAKAYILYRAERTRIRETNSRLMQTLRDITFKPSKENDAKRENANINGDTAMGTMLKYGSESAKSFYLNYLVEPRFAKAHQEGEIHIHDLDFYSLTMTCCQIDLIKLFKNGFSTGNGFLREPNDIRSYSALACIAIQANQNDQHGGQSVPNFDYSMALGVRKTYRKLYIANLAKLIEFVLGLDVTNKVQSLVEKVEEENNLKIAMVRPDIDQLVSNKVKEEFALDDTTLQKVMNETVKTSYNETRRATYQAMEALLCNLNTMHSRAGAQVPFSSINYGTDTSEEGRMVMDCLLDATEAGLGDGETPIFPIQIFKIKEGINYNPQDKNYDLFKKSLVVSGKRLFPNFSFIDAPFNLQYYKEGDYNTEIAYMGCRTRVIGNTYDPSNEIVTGRGNLSFTSINLPRAALKTRKYSAFIKEIDRLIDLVIDQLLERFYIQSKKKVYNFPFLMGQGVWLGSENLKYDDEVSEIIKHGTLSIGFIGLAEALKVLTGHHHGESKEAQEMGIKIITHMRKRCDDASDKFHLNFSLLATPAEGLSGRFIQIDKQKFGIIEGVTDKDFYTNSFHVPVYYPISAFEKINREAPYHALTNAGHISYVEVDGDIAKNPKAFEKIIRHMKEKGIGYGSVNHPVDRDPVCGYNGIINNECPKCHRTENGIKFERIRRITGYLVGTLDRFNNAKRQEVEYRVKHTGLDNEN